MSLRSARHFFFFFMKSEAFSGLASFKGILKSTSVAAEG